MITESDLIQAFVGTCSFTLLFPKYIAEVLGIRNGDILKFDVNGDRLIVEKYHSPVTNQTSVMADDKNRFELRNTKVAENRIGSLRPKDDKVRM
jgi:bifunctional DNA-binding transcriptional regulator/antitoxin component of YhaV-PrlF toxin-antitoxin module